MTPPLLKPGTTVATKHGDGVILKIDMTTYGVPMYHVLLLDGEYADETIYISDPRVTPEISQPEHEFKNALTRAYNEGFAAGHDDGYQEGCENVDE